MISKLRLPILAIIVLFVALSSVALVPPGPLSLGPTPTAPVSHSPTPTAGKTRLTSTQRATTGVTGTPRKIRPTASPQTAKTATATFPVTATLSPTPGKTKPTPALPLSQAGNTDRIVLIGILIVAIIITPIMLKRREWRGN